MTKAEIKDYLDNYTERKAVAAFRQKQGNTEDRTVVVIKAIEECMLTLPDGLGEILRMVYIEKQSLRKISNQHYACKDTIARRRDEGITIMSKCLEGL